MEHNDVRATVASALALLISEPGNELIDALNSGELYKLLEVVLDVDERDKMMLRDKIYTLEGLTELYSMCIASVGRAASSFVESLYKPWTDDEGIHPSLHAKKGLLMGDPAQHMLQLYRQFGFETPAEFSAQPDHLILELEFLSFLYENCPDTMVLQFIKDHLDWVSELPKKCLELKMAPFYCSAIRAVDAFIRQERSRLEITCEVNV